MVVAFGEWLELCSGIVNKPAAVIATAQPFEVCHA